MRLNIQTKLFFLLAGLTAVILVGVLFVINQTVSDKIEDNVIADFNRTQAFFQKEQVLIYDRLVESCYLIGENSIFKANVALEDPASVYFSVDELANFAKIDLFIVTDRVGKVLARYGEPGNFGDDLTDRPNVVRALNGEEPDFEISWAELWAIDNTLYQVVSLPVFTDNAIIGTITLGSQISSFDAKELKGESDIDITIFLENKPIASTLFDSLKATAADTLSKFTIIHKPIIDAVLSSLSSSGVFSTSLFSEEVFAFLYPLGEGEPAYYLASVSKTAELKFLNALKNNIFLTALISFVITILIAFLLGKNFSRPILRLVEGMNKVKEGDLNVKIQPSTKDEIGLLTQAFNGMIIGLRERFHLAKYVGSHTLEMIRESSGEDVSLGGTRKDLAVLFSDIRGFTAYSEQRTPEEVIEMLNKYLGFQAEFVNLYNGSVDKFVGDEMVALFSGEDSIKRALDCAIAIQKLVKKEQQNEFSPINVGIGVNYGPMVLGNMGAEERMDYTVIGAAVNLGARLCSAANPGQILIRKQLLASFNNSFPYGKAQMMSFKGFSKEIEIVEVLSE
jgi:class 3 adenylate cyclase